jgi:hypothetical protein
VRLYVGTFALQVEEKRSPTYTMCLVRRTLALTQGCQTHELGLFLKITWKAFVCRAGHICALLWSWASRQSLSKEL